MYIPQLFETLSEPLHVERIASANRKRLAQVRSAVIPETSRADAFHGLLCSLRTLARRVGYLSDPEPRVRLPTGGE